MPPTSADADFDDSKKWKATPGSILQRKVPCLDAGQWVYNILLVLSSLPQLSYTESYFARVQHLPAHEKIQVQDFHNWVSSSSEGTSRSAPESPVIGLIENPVASLPNVDMAGKSNEPNPEAPDHTPAAAKGASNAGGTGSSGAEGSRGPAVRLVPFQSMPQSTQEELGKELFDDPLLSIENVKKLVEYMQLSFKYTKVSILLLFVFLE